MFKDGGIAQMHGLHIGRLINIMLADADQRLAYHAEGRVLGQQEDGGQVRAHHPAHRHVPAAQANKEAALHHHAGGQERLKSDHPFDHRRVEDGEAGPDAAQTVPEVRRRVIEFRTSRRGVVAQQAEIGKGRADPGFGPPQRRHVGQEIRLPKVVAIAESHEVPGHPGQPCVAGRQVAAIGHSHQAHALAITVFDHAANVVCRAVIHQHDLMRRYGLRQNGVQRARQQAALIMGGDNHAEARLNHERPSAVSRLPQERWPALPVV